MNTPPPPPPPPPPPSPPARSATAITRGDVVVALVLLAALIDWSRQPLWHTDVWGHLAYGRVYAETGQLPDREPLLALSEPVEYVAPAWLSQWGGYHLDRHGGAVGLQLFHAVAIAGSCGVLYLCLKRRDGEELPALLILAAYVALEWQQILVIRPQMAALVCFSLVLLFFRGRRRTWFALPVLLLWVNLHGSFPIGLVAPGLMLLGESLDVWARTGTLRRVWSNHHRQRQALILACLTGVTLCNPYGVRLIVEVLTFSGNPNLSTLVEWKPIYETPRQGTVVLVVVIVSVIVLMLSRRRFRWREGLPALAFGVLMFASSRYIVWFAALWSLAIFPHWCDLCARLVLRRQTPRDAAQLPRPGWWIAIATIGALACTPFGWAVLGRGEWSPRAAYGSRTPLAATEVLAARVPKGLVLNTMEWGDWLLWSVPDGPRPFVASHVQFLPARVWDDYQLVSKSRPGWREAAARYPFVAALLDARKQRELIDELDRDPRWERIYSDSLAAVFVVVDDRGRD